jgi:predicted transcriptional regulator of viral defense system
MKNNLHLLQYVESLQRQGRYLFLKGEALKTLGISDSALKISLSRLCKKGKIAYLKKGLYQIIPIEYEINGSLPPEWIIHDLMIHLNIPYYVGLLSAAALHGAAHQAPQIFQVICQRQIPNLVIGSSKICFYKSQNMSIIPTQNFKTPAGYAHVSTPEGTAFDLIRYIHQSGNLNHVATVLSELSESMDSQKLLLIAQKISIRYTQRLGYILDFIGYGPLTDHLYQFVSQKNPIYTPLRSDHSVENADKNKKWHLFINETIETDIGFLKILSRNGGRRLPGKTMLKLSKI